MYGIRQVEKEGLDGGVMRMARRIVTGQISHETNAFSSIGTDLERFSQRCYLHGEEARERFRGTRTPLGAFYDFGQEAGWETVSTVAAAAVPSGLVSRDAHETLVDQLLEGIRSQERVDGILLSLHGAMVTEGICDAEGDILTRVRELVGPEIPVVSTLDYHANLTDRMVSQADGLFGYNTYPHVDGWERGMEAAQFLADLLEKRITPRSFVIRPPLAPAIVPARTGAGPVKKLMERAFAWEEEEGVINVSVYGGFVYSDIHDAGLAFLVTTDGDVDRARHIAGDLAEQAWEMRHDFAASLKVPREAVLYAMEADVGPVVLADVADNTGGGAAGDGTEILKSLLQLEAQDAVVVTIPDPEAVEEAFSRGIGGELDAMVGGKVDHLHGEPVRLRGRVRLLSDGRFIHRGPMATGLEGFLGRTAVVQSGGVEVILNERRFQPLDPEVPRSVGIDPVHRKIVVVKSSVHYRAAYEPLAGEIVEVDGPGLSSPNLDRFEFKNIRRPVFPLDDM